MRRVWTIAGVALLTLAIGCGGNDGPEAQPAEVEPRLDQTLLLVTLAGLT